MMEFLSFDYFFNAVCFVNPDVCFLLFFSSFKQELLISFHCP